MSQTKLQSYLENIIKVGIFTCLFIPLIVTPFTLFPFVWGKATLFQVIIKIIFALWVLLAFLDKKYLPRPNLILGAVLIWLGILILSTIFSVNPYHSFWSTVERREGLVLFLHLGAFFLILVSMFKEGRDWLKLFQVSIFVSLLVSLYSLWQLSPIKLPFIAPAQHITQPGGSLGNPVYVGSYLLFQIFLILILFFNSEDLRRKVIYGSIFIFQAAIVFFLVNARSASLGILSALFVSFFLYIVFETKPKIKISFILIAASSLVLAGILFFTASSGYFKENFFINRFFNLKQNFIQVGATGKERLLEWEVAIKGLKEKPILGWGLDNFPIIYDKYFPAEHPYYFTVEQHTVGVDRAHSLYFDWASTTGILGLASFVSIIGGAVYLLWRKWRKKEIPSVVIYLLFGLFAGYLIEGIFIFDTLNSFIPLFMIIGFTYFLTKKPKGDSSPSETGTVPTLPNFILYSLFFILVVALAFAIYIIDVKPTKAVILARQALITKNTDERLDLLNRSFSLNTFTNDEVKLNFANGFNPQDRGYFEKGFSIAESELRETIKNNPLNVRYYLALGKLYNKKGAVYDSSYLGKAEEILKAALELSPTRQELYYETGSTYIFKKEFANAGGYFQKALDLDPKFPKAHWFLGISQIAEGNLDKAKETLDQAIDVSQKYPVPAQFFAMPEILWISQVYGRIGYSLDSLQYFEGLLVLYPQNDVFYQTLAILYLQENKLDKAEETARKAVEINPDLKEEIGKFLEYIEKLKNSQK